MSTTSLQPANEKANESVEQLIEARVRDAVDSNAIELDLSKSRLRELPPTIRRLPHLEKLNLSENQLERLPEWFVEFRSLKQLDLSQNRLRTVPEAIAELIGLENLRITHNQLTELPEFLTHLRQLRKLWLWGNALHVIPPWIAEAHCGHRPTYRRQRIANAA